MKASSFFVTGTDTGVGKTVVSTVLARGLGAHYWKPIQTGANEGCDSEFVGRWIDKEKVLKESYCLQEPASPHIASHTEGVQISLAKCLADARQISTSTIVEGAGGVLVPLNSTSLLIDFMVALQLPTVLVASTKLGTINHTLLTLEALRRRNLSMAGLITVGPENRKVQEILVNFGRTKNLGHISFTENFSHDWFEQTFCQLNWPTAMKGECHV